MSPLETRITAAHRAGRGPFASRPGAVEVHAARAPEFRCWSIWAVDSDGDQIGACEYAPNRAAVIAAFK